MQTPDPIVTAARRIEELQSIRDRIDGEAGDLMRQLEASTGDNRSTRAREQSMEESMRHTWDAIESLRAVIVSSEATTAACALAQLVQVWDCGHAIADNTPNGDYLRDLDRLCISIAGYLSNEAGIPVKGLGTTGFVAETNLKVLEERLKRTLPQNQG